MAGGEIMAQAPSDDKHGESYPPALLKVDAVLFTAGVTAVMTGLVRLIQLALSGEEISVYLWADPRHPMQWFVWWIGFSISALVWSPYGLAVGLADVFAWGRIGGGLKLWMAEILLCVLCGALFSVNWWSWIQDGETLSFVPQRIPALFAGAVVGIIGRRAFVRHAQRGLGK